MKKAKKVARLIINLVTFLAFLDFQAIINRPLLDLVVNWQFYNRL